VSASRALSIPEAFRAASLRPAGPVVISSSFERSNVPRVFLVAVLALAFLGVDLWDCSSAAKRTSRSAFLRCASARLASTSSLEFRETNEWLVVGYQKMLDTAGRVSARRGAVFPPHNIFCA